MPETLKKAEYTLHFLMDAFREVLEDVGMGEVAKQLPWADLETMQKPVAFPDDIAEACMQAYSVSLQLLNQAEENAVAQHRRAIENRGELVGEPGSWDQVLAELEQAGVSPEKMAERLASICIEPVLTAHPTEAKRQTVHEHHRTLYKLLVQLENSMWTEAEREEFKEQAKACLERLWRTGEIFLDKPSLADERRNVLHYLGHVFPAVLPWTTSRLRGAWKRAGYDPALIDSPERLPKLRFGNWVGGDRDGHPGVTAPITEETLGILRHSALILLDEHLQQLGVRVSLSERRQQTPSSVTLRIEALSNLLGSEGQAAVERNPEEPWRQYVNLIRAALPKLEEREHWQYSNAVDLITDLKLLRQGLMEVGASRLARADVDPLISLVETFGFQLARLDVRQNSAFHDRALAQLLGAAGDEAGLSYPDWSLEKRREMLERELSTRRPFASADDVAGDEAKAVLDAYRVLANHKARYGTDGLGALIISMTRSTEDLLAVYVLARDGGLLERNSEGSYCPLEVVPLFETIDDLHRAPEVMDDYLSLPLVRRSLAFRAGEGGELIQQVMIGYSDSGKDGGIVSSMWGLNRVQSRLAEVGQKHGVRIRFFHGRGGTIGRGAGPTHRFVSALPPGTVQGDLRLTEQGETISQKYANHVTAAHHLELLSAGVFAATVADEEGRSDPPDLVAIMDELADRSRVAYRSLLDADGFIEFFSQATPLDVIESSSIGSRPARRSGKRTIGDLRAIPWVFAWNQSRFVIPGWYGLGSALEELHAKNPDGFKALVLAATEGPDKGWAPLHYLVSNAATALMTSSSDIMTRYASLVENRSLSERLMKQIVAEQERTHSMLESLYEGSLREKEPLVQQVIDRRNQALLPLHDHQIQLLRRWREAKAGSESGESPERLLQQLLLSVNAIASGLGATG